MVADTIYDLLPSSINPHVGELPAQRVNATAIIEFEGNVSTEYFGHTAMHEPLIKLVVRHESYATGQSWITSAFDAVNRQQDKVKNILACFAVGTPIYLGLGEHNLHEFQTTFRIQTKE